MALTTLESVSTQTPKALKTVSATKLLNKMIQTLNSLKNNPMFCLSLA